MLSLNAAAFSVEALLTDELKRVETHYTNSESSNLPEEGEERAEDGEERAEEGVERAEEEEENEKMKKRTIETIAGNYDRFEIETKIEVVDEASRDDDDVCVEPRKEKLPLSIGFREERDHYKRVKIKHKGIKHSWNVVQEEFKHGGGLTQEHTTSFDQVYFLPQQHTHADIPGRDSYDFVNLKDLSGPADSMRRLTERLTLKSPRAYCSSNPREEAKKLTLFESGVKKRLNLPGGVTSDCQRGDAGCSGVERGNEAYMTHRRHSESSSPWIHSPFLPIMGEKIWQGQVDSGGKNACNSIEINKDEKEESRCNDKNGTRKRRREPNEIAHLDWGPRGVVEPSAEGSGQECDQSIRVELLQQELWHKFHHLGTEMIITKNGRRMFPVVKVHLDGLCPERTYAIYLDMVSVDAKRYRYVYPSSQWMVAGTGEPLGQQPPYVHPDSPASGEHWMAVSVVAFDRLKLTNNKGRIHSAGQLCLFSMQKYQPRVWVQEIPTGLMWAELANQLDYRTAHATIFPNTTFITVTAYQNQQITKLKIDSNPFAKGFRDTPKHKEVLHHHAMRQQPASDPQHFATSSGVIPLSRSLSYPPLHAFLPPLLPPPWMAGVWHHHQQSLMSSWHDSTNESAEVPGVTYLRPKPQVQQALDLRKHKTQ